jgi:hypothetical protein
MDVSVEQIQLALDKDRLWAVVNAVIGVLIPLKCGKFLE